MMKSVGASGSTRCAVPLATPFHGPQESRTIFEAIVAGLRSCFGAEILVVRVARNGRSFVVQPDGRLIVPSASFMICSAKLGESTHTAYSPRRRSSTHGCTKVRLRP